MEFSPDNPVIQRCIQAMSAEAKGEPEEAGKLLMQAWKEATTDFEKFTAAHLVGRYQQNPDEQLEWFKKALEHGKKADAVSVQGALSTLYGDIARCYETLGDADSACIHNELAISVKNQLKDEGPFYHGTRANLKTGDLLVAGGQSNYQANITMNHIYFTALINGAGLAAALAKGDGAERIYIVEPTGSFEDDPNVTDKKFPGNPTRSYRSEAPLKIIGEVTGWAKLTPEEKRKWNEKLENNKGEIIN
ncbi:NAD(+)--rifampin ADP-ribosyltransferase [Niabella hibiscisoli]|nr:NAD(+)--rifampin ADP-ribosyltransferase [Niabella hibiscisoli]MCH5720166.1 NAD(+)--rifampin ADP-ribosyltransferase [Niabella hibiscisoli]